MLMCVFVWTLRQQEAGETPVCCTVRLCRYSLRLIPLCHSVKSHPHIETQQDTSTPIPPIQDGSWSHSRADYSSFSDS